MQLSSAVNPRERDAFTKPVLKLVSQGFNRIPKPCSAGRQNSFVDTTSWPRTQSPLLNLFKVANGGAAMIIGLPA